MGESSIVVRPQPPGLRRAIAAFERAAEAVPLPDPPQPIVLADYGAADGRNALLPLGAAITVIRRRTRHEHAVLVAHTDAPHNDFTDLFSTLADDPDSYLHTDSASFPAAIGRSFYGQILPSKSVTLGWTSWATMWLSRPAAELPEIPDHVLSAYSADDTARAAYARQAAQDWHDFVAFRGRELGPGGRLTVLTMAVGEDGEFGYRPLFDAIAATLGDQVRDGLLGAEEARRMTIPIFARSEKDFRAPFAPSDRFEGCSIEQLEIFEADDPFWADYAADHDAARFGARWAAFTRLSAFPTLAGALDGGRTDPRAEDFAAHLEGGVAAHLASKPEPMRIPLAVVVLVKRGGPA
ncbi:SAM-dependent methyltransferase [Mycobacterium sp. pUA109]|uniref:SAM-dependent methyltransferase n=1 Tax=Mycobacterium sp. pUA109 TaxID=3238982 RepID=UPI00351B0D99